MATEERDRARLRPRIGGKHGGASSDRAPTLRTALLTRLERRFGRTARLGKSILGRPRARRAAIDVREPAPDARRCVVKSRVVPMDRRGVAAARLHLDYIEREGVEPDGSKGQVFGDELDARESLRAPLEGEKHQFRIIVSPEDGDLDLRAFTRSLMRRVQADLGRDLIWGAVRHHDTGTPHVHIVIRGVDKTGRQVRIDPDYIARGMRWRAQSISTEELGPRSAYEIARQRDREITQERFTTLDRELERRAKPGVDLAALKRIAPKDRARLIARLEVLEQLALAHRRTAGSWTLVDGWQDTLHALGTRGDIIKRMHAALYGQGNTSRYRALDGTREQAPVEGVLRRKGLHDELRGEMYAIIEDAAGGAHYVCVDRATAERVAEGSIVRAAVVREPWKKPMDAVIAAVAAENVGIYDPAVHQAALSNRAVLVAGRRAEPAEVVAANVRRLERLARHKHVVRLEGGRWRVPPDFLAQLGTRDISQPHLRVSLDALAPSLRGQVDRRGPTWLDRIAQTQPAPYGFGADVQRARAERAKFIAALGLAEGPGTPADRLTELERKDVGAKIAANRQLRFVADPPPGFRGMVVQSDVAGGRYTAVVDQRAREVAIVPSGLAPPELKGQVVEIVRGPAGQVQLRQRGLAKER